MTPRRINPPHYFLASLATMAALGWLGAGEPLLPAPWHWTGVAPVAIGVALAVIAAGRFAKVGTNIVPLTTSTTLVTSGPFAFSRNPMYLGMTLTLVGAALLANTPWPWIVPPIFVAILKLRFIRHEEALMESTFGDAYRAYKARVRRWL
jgi:protein-S-isoprenylcysteine O-methyltransferase Ste14